MDIRIVNTCNNDCLYCLEQSYRTRDPSISLEILYAELAGNLDRDSLTFYGWNPLLHPHIEEIMNHARTLGYKSLGILSNTGWLSPSLLEQLVWAWLSTFWVYFHTFHEWYHDLITGSGIPYRVLLQNLELLAHSSLQVRIIIHINGITINSVYRDIVLLYKNYWIQNFEFVNYFPFDRPYEKYKSLLHYDIAEKREKIDTLFKVIKKLNLRTNFVKFSRDFFWEFDTYYNYEKGILAQIGEEDISRLNTKDDMPPFCFEEKRCPACFIKDNCKFYGNRSPDSRKIV